MLGSRANVKCISPLQRPVGVDDGVVVDEAFSSEWQNDGGFIQVKKSVYLLVGRFARIMG
jgi:hypothetical protein